MSNGVKQGVISPILFGLYLNQMLFELKKSKIGCYINVYIGGLTYADGVQ